jgi:hypothetical protein
MAVDPVNSTPSPTSPTDTSVTDTTSSSNTTSTKKVDPNSEEEILNAAVEAFIPSMISNTMMLNNSIFNFAKEAIDEGDEG